MNITVSLAKASDLMTGPSVEAQLQNLQERVWMLARELDAANLELAVRKDIEVELTRFALEMAAESEALRDMTEALTAGLGLALSV